MTLKYPNNYIKSNKTFRNFEKNFTTIFQIKTFFFNFIDIFKTILRRFCRRKNIQKIILIRLI